jgi:hypothetical protein
MRGWRTVDGENIARIALSVTVAPQKKGVPLMSAPYPFRDEDAAIVRDQIRWWRAHDVVADGAAAALGIPQKGRWPDVSRFMVKWLRQRRGQA